MVKKRKFLHWIQLTSKLSHHKEHQNGWRKHSLKPPSRKLFTLKLIINEQEAHALPKNKHTRRIVKRTGKWINRMENLMKHQKRKSRVRLVHCKRVLCTEGVGNVLPLLKLTWLPAHPTFITWKWKRKHINYVTLDENVTGYKLWWTATSE